MFALLPQDLVKVILEQISLKDIHHLYRSHDEQPPQEILNQLAIRFNLPSVDNTGKLLWMSYRTDFHNINHCITSRDTNSLQRLLGNFYRTINFPNNIDPTVYRAIADHRLKFDVGEEDMKYAIMFDDCERITKLAARGIDIPTPSLTKLIDDKRYDILVLLPSALKHTWELILSYAVCIRDEYLTDLSLSHGAQGYEITVFNPSPEFLTYLIGTRLWRVVLPYLINNKSKVIVNDIVMKYGLTSTFDVIYKTCTKGDLIWFAFNVEIVDRTAENKMIRFTLDYVKYYTDNKHLWMNVREWLTNDRNYKFQYASQWQRQ